MVWSGVLFLPTSAQIPLPETTSPLQDSKHLLILVNMCLEPVRLQAAEGRVIQSGEKSAGTGLSTVLPASAFSSYSLFVKTKVGCWGFRCTVFHITLNETLTFIWTQNSSFMQDMDIFCAYYDRASEIWTFCANYDWGWLSYFSCAHFSPATMHAAAVEEGPCPLDSEIIGKRGWPDLLYWCHRSPGEVGIHAYVFYLFIQISFPA